MAHLAQAGEVSDEAGMASSVLAREVGYPGSSIAFAQLLSGMERSGLIQREVRGKRTYRITAAAADAARLGPVIRHKAGLRAGAGVTAVSGFDYDELARRLLVQVVRQLATPATEPPVEVVRPDGAGLEQVIAGLEQELASARTLHSTLSAENARLREQLRAARRSLALAQQQVGGQQVAEQLDPTEVGLLERLLSQPAEPAPDEEAG
jgi:DNA-binding response OmpR family regulator